MLPSCFSDIKNVNTRLLNEFSGISSCVKDIEVTSSRIIIQTFLVQKQITDWAKDVKQFLAYQKKTVKGIFWEKNPFIVHYF